MELKKIYENEDIIIYENDKGYDFKYTIENTSDKEIIYHLGIDDYLILEGGKHISYLIGNYTEEFIQCIINEDFEKISLLKEIENIEEELKNIKNENKEKILEYINYKLYWLKDLVKKIED